MEKKDVTILIIDDDEDQLMVFEMLFRKTGYNVVTAEDGLDALEVLEKNKVDLVLCDINMPRMDGIEFIGEFRKKDCYKKTPVVALTAGRFDMKPELTAAGATDFCEKKDIKQLVQRLPKIISETAAD